MKLAMRTALRLALVGTVALGACGGGNANQPPPTLATASAQAGVTPVTPESLERDPLALFPSGALGMFAVDLRAFYRSPSAGPAAAALAENISRSARRRGSPRRAISIG